MEQQYINNLKKIRIEKGFTQRQVASLMNLQCEARISQWENGVAVPSIFNLFRLCQIYQVTCHEAFSYLHPTNPEQVDEVRHEHGLGLLEGRGI